VSSAQQCVLREWGPGHTSLCLWEFTIVLGTGLFWNFLEVFFPNTFRVQNLCTRKQTAPHSPTTQRSLIQCPSLHPKLRTAPSLF
jgi:hypothetical protein